MASKDWEGLRDGMEVALKQQLAGLIDGNVADLDGPVRDAANRMVVAIRRGPAGEALVEEIRDELAVRLLENKVRAQGAIGSTLDVAIGVGLNMLFQGAINGMNAVKPA